MALMCSPESTNASILTMLRSTAVGRAFFLLLEGDCTHQRNVVVDRVVLDDFLMTSRSSGSDGGYSVVSSLLPGTSVADSVCGGGGGERVASLCCCACRDQIVLSLIQMMFSA